MPRYEIVAHVTRELDCASAEEAATEFRRQLLADAGLADALLHLGVWRADPPQQHRPCQHPYVAAWWTFSPLSNAAPARRRKRFGAGRGDPHGPGLAQLEMRMALNRFRQRVLSRSSRRPAWSQSGSRTNGPSATDRWLHAIPTARYADTRNLTISTSSNDPLARPASYGYYLHDAAAIWVRGHPEVIAPAPTWPRRSPTSSPTR